VNPYFVPDLEQYAGIFAPTETAVYSCGDHEKERKEYLLELLSNSLPLRNAAAG
jgi:hypothetical protein